MIHDMYHTTNSFGTRYIFFTLQHLSLDILRNRRHAYLAMTQALRNARLPEVDPELRFSCIGINYEGQCLKGKGCSNELLILDMARVDIAIEGSKCI